MIEYAAEQGVAAILIAGDLFDTNSVSRTAMSAVYTSIIEHPDIAFYYLKGNHDVNSFLASMEEIPENLHLFSDTWTSYEVGTTRRGRVMLSGVELNAENSSLIYPALSLDSRDLNIVTLHGQSAEYRSKDKTEVISMSLLKIKELIIWHWGMCMPMWWKHWMPEEFTAIRAASREEALTNAGSMVLKCLPLKKKPERLPMNLFRLLTAICIPCRWM